MLHLGIHPPQYLPTDRRKSFAPGWHSTVRLLKIPAIIATSKETEIQFGSKPIWCRNIMRVLSPAPRIAWLLLLLFLLPVPSQSAHSRRRIVIVREKDIYDRVITDFSPDGRLSQVEYGMEASRRGSAIAAAITSAGICLIIQNSSFGKMHRIDHHIWLVTTGLSGDARILARQLRVGCQQHREEYEEAPTTEEVARMAGQYQHYLTRSGGIRPLGCTALVLGIDPVADGEIQIGMPRIFQTDPGGIVEAITSHCAAGKGCDVIAKELGSIVASHSKESPTTSSLSRLALKMVQSVLGKLSDPKTVDVWTIEPQRGKRGGMLATCYQKVDRDGASTMIRDRTD